MYGIFHIRSVSVGLDSQIWYLFIYIIGYLNVRKISETMDFRTFVGPLLFGINQMRKDVSGIKYEWEWRKPFLSNAADCMTIFILFLRKYQLTPLSVPFLSLECQNFMLWYSSHVTFFTNSLFSVHLPRRKRRQKRKLKFLFVLVCSETNL